MNNPFAAVVAAQEHLKNLLGDGKLNHIKTIKDVPNFEEIRTKGVSYVNDGAVFVYPNGLSTKVQRAHGKNSKDIINVGVALSIRTSNTQSLHYVTKLGEAYVSLREALDTFEPKVDGGRFFIPRDGSKSAEERHLIGDGFVFITMNYTFESIS